MNRAVTAVMAVLASTVPLSAQTTVYSPLSAWQSPYATWETIRLDLEMSAGQRSARPVLPGVRPAVVELLQDAVLRKHPQLLRNDASLARRVILDKYLGRGSARSRINGRNFLNGAMAEALFLKEHPDWKYVLKPNARQHDVYRLQAGRPPTTGQVKFHVDGNPNVYANDMRRDHQAHRFFIPDDHVQPVREYWLREYQAARARGDVAAAKVAARNAGRVQPMGVTAQEVVLSNKQALRYVAAEARAVYVSLAASVALSLGQLGWDYAHGAVSSDQVAYRATKALSLLGTGMAADSALLLVKQGALRGTLRGNVLVGAAVLLVETSWNVYEHGGLAAFRHPEFYEQLGGSISALGLGGAAAFYSGAAATAATIEFGPAAPVIGGITAVGVGTVVGIVAYMGGRSATAWLVRSVWPEFYQQFERQQIDAVAKDIDRRLSEAMAAPQ